VIPSGACFAAAIESGDRATLLASSPEGWRSVAIDPRGGGAVSPPIAPAGDRWLARASDGVTAFTSGERSVYVRRPGAAGSERAIAQAPASVTQLAVERLETGYLVAWSHQGARGATAQFLADDLSPTGDPEDLPVGAAGLALARWRRGEAWVAAADATGALEVVRLFRGGRAQGLSIVRSGAVSAVAIAPTNAGAVVAYAIERDGRRAVYAFGARCRAADGTPRPR
jgi:hypothetical protein